jgi:hypothetical protein
MMSDCPHQQITTWVTQDGKASGLWSCAACKHKFVPLDLVMEKDAERYRWLRDHADVELEFDHMNDEAGCTLHFHCEWIEEDHGLDEDVDSAMAIWAEDNAAIDAALAKP